MLLPLPILIANDVSKHVLLDNILFTYGCSHVIHSPPNMHGTKSVHRRAVLFSVLIPVAPIQLMVVGILTKDADND